MLTDGIPGFDWVCSDSERAHSKTILSTDSEQVFLTFKKVRYHKGHTGAGRIYSCPCLSAHGLLFNEVALDSLSTISIWKLPDDPHRGSGNISDFKFLWWTWYICEYRIYIIKYRIIFT